MPDRHDRRDDDVDSWLSGRIDPLPPPPGTFELIKRRARHRKYRRLAITAGAAAVIVAAGVAVPQIVRLSPLGPVNPSGHNSAVPSPGTTATGGGAPESSSSARPAPSPSRPPVPPNFQPTSVTFVSTSIGWVIGQAGTPGHCATQYCTSVARTDNAGKTWFGVPAPLTGAPDGATGVGGIRFLNGEDGWAFGPELFATHDAGHTWTRVNTDGLRVTDLETVGDRAFAVFASCTGSGPDFAAQCTKFTLYSSPAGADDWTPVGASTSGLTGPGGPGSASIVLTGSRGYLLGPDGMLLSGPVDGTAWSPVARVPCAAGTAQPDGQPTGALFGAIDATNLIIACTQPAAGPVGGEQKVIYSSADGGASWNHLATAPTAGIASAVAASPSQTVVLGTDQGIDLLGAGGSGWQQATLVTGAPAGGFQYVGMTTDLQGIALPVNATDGVVWFTFDGGASWQPSLVSRP
jgi:photosystem II stability/assembly factor-like uncharacterized protein